MNLVLQQFAVEAGPDLAPRYNMAPTQNLPVVRLGESGDREMILMRWGLIPSWAKDMDIGNRMINARAETVSEKPSFRTAFKRRRCLVPADGYYEWQKTGKTKQPYLIQVASHQPFAMAGLWETWNGPDKADPPIESFAVITTEACPATRPIHDRMPVIISPEDFERWLDLTITDPDPLRPLLQPYSAGEMRAVRVSTFVNNPRNNDERCIEPVSDG
jgi:putative SOS response-associated peptidase YedK